MWGDLIFDTSIRVAPAAVRVLRPQTWSTRPCDPHVDIQVFQVGLSLGSVTRLNLDPVFA